MSYFFLIRFSLIRNLLALGTGFGFKQAIKLNEYVLPIVIVVVLIVSGGVSAPNFPESNGSQSTMRQICAGSGVVGPYTHSILYTYIVD